MFAQSGLGLFAALDVRYQLGLHVVGTPAPPHRIFIRFAFSAVTLALLADR